MNSIYATVGAVSGFVIILYLLHLVTGRNVATEVVESADFEVEAPAFATHEQIVYVNQEAKEVKIKSGSGWTCEVVESID